MSNQYENIPEEYRPISMWGYFGYQILFSIPVIGFICLLVCALGGRNKNVRNFARSYFCVLILALIVVALIISTAGGLAAIAALLPGLTA